ncbi:YoaK family protein [Labedella endophytica]|uniref:DUF1275 domain-containing protein n=1 Tax=Labedella endophytica TaxID=1523160 RepID=A0A3S0WY56_9MICO|nr:YoaK family protein [Labedella endophytica]RUR00918.1 DUF1275 domain-containing protein [Labedella endophytica]
MSSHAHRYTAGLILLTAATGAIDAVSYLALDRVFTGNMTGNVLFIGFALVGVAGIPFLNNVVALGGFVLGSIVSGRIVGRKHERLLPRRSMWTLVAGGAVIASLSVTWAVLGTLDERGLLVVTALLAIVMGAQVSAVKPIGNSDVTTIVVTNTLANLARDSRLAGGHGQAWVQRLLAVIAMGGGAALGAVLIGWLSGAAALAAGGALYVSAVVLLTLTSRSERRATARATL